MLTKHQNGAFVIVLNPTDEIVVVQQNYGDHLWMLPGGGIERGELPGHAGQEETEEESGLWIYQHKLELVALFTQRLGLLPLFQTSYYEGVLRKEPSNEIRAAQFMSFQEIIDRRQ